MNAAALPYTLLLILLELTAGSVAVASWFDARRMVTRGYVQAGALVTLPMAICALAIVLNVVGTADIDGYVLDEAWWLPLRWSLIALVAVLAVYLVATFTEAFRFRVASGVVASLVGAHTLIVIAALIAPATWSVAGTIASVLVGAAVLGGALMAMTWGHWYLTNSGLPKEPLEQMSLLVLGAVGVSAVLTVLGAALVPRQEPLADSVTVGLIANPVFWLRIGVGLVFPTLLTTLAWKAAAVRGMMSATGLLYIALGAVLAGELMARGLLFATGLLV
ncbi:MAG: hypothetical protein EXR66_04475 [Dehalococcoidia bacterium]|nr:hypothetical protein [Dehalococcoidia bacterium]